MKQYQSKYDDYDDNHADHDDHDDDGDDHELFSLCFRSDELLFAFFLENIIMIIEQRSKKKQITFIL